MEPQYNVTRQIAVRLTRPGISQPIEGRLASVDQPLTRIWFNSRSAPKPGEYSFELLLRELPLVSGSGRLLPHKAKPETSCLQILQLSDPSGPVEHLLAPLIDPHQRSSYLDSADQTPGQFSAALAGWIDFCARQALLLELLAEINSEVDSHALLQRIMTAACQIMDTEASSLMLQDPESRDLLVQVPTGPVSLQITGHRIPAGKGFAGWVAEHRQPLIVDSPSEDARFFGELVDTGFQTRNLICVPLISTAGEVIGVLQVMNKIGSSRFEPAEVPLLTSLAEQAAIALDRARLVAESIRRQVLERELELASEIQSGFRPKELPTLPAIQFAGSSRPAAEVGGDYYDVVTLPDGRIGLVVADVSGKGVSAALLMATVRASLRTLLDNQLEPAQIVSRVNNALVEDSPSSRFVTLFLGILDPQTVTLSYVNAGHNPPLLVAATGEILQRLDAGGTIAGFRTDLPYDSEKVYLPPGSRIVMFSDGITEAQDSAEEMFGDERLEALLQKHAVSTAPELQEIILKQVEVFCDGASQSDDMTLLIVSLE